MATTKIWDIKHHLKRVINYISNPEKTEVPDEINYLFNGLATSISYTTQDMKTEKQLYVTGINTTLSTAFEDMVLTKKTYQKEDGILAFHAYQSFKPNEVNAENAHQIGIELAKILWGDRFEVLVSTHLDKHHYHNHFVINSVSFKDGKRFYDNHQSYSKMRQVSDYLCEKYKLSIITDKKDKSIHYSEWKQLEQRKPTKRKLIAEDVDYAISKSRSKKEFFDNLRNMGYSIKIGKYVSLRPRNAERSFRMHKLTNDSYYDMQKVMERIYQNSKVHFVEPSPAHTTKPLRGSIKSAKKITGFKALYFRYMYLLGVIPNHAPKQKVHFYLKQDLLKLDQITEEITFLAKKNINTIEELESSLGIATERKSYLENERKSTYGKIKRCRNPDSKSLMEIDIKDMTNELKALRKEVVLYERIKKRSLKMRETIQLVNDQHKNSKSTKNIEMQTDNR